MDMVKLACDQVWLQWSFQPACCSLPVELRVQQQNMLAGAKRHQLLRPSKHALSCTHLLHGQRNAVAVLSVPSSLPGLSISLYSQFSTCWLTLSEVKVPRVLTIANRQLHRGWATLLWAPQLTNSLNSIIKPAHLLPFCGPSRAT